MSVYKEIAKELTNMSFSQNEIILARPNCSFKDFSLGRGFLIKTFDVKDGDYVKDGNLFIEMNRDHVKRLREICKELISTGTGKGEYLNKDKTVWAFYANLCEGSYGWIVKVNFYKNEFCEYLNFSINDYQNEED